VWAVHDECPHAFQPLQGGRVRNGWIQCPQHGACFDIKTGAPQNTRITARPVLVFPVRVEDGRVLVSPKPLGA
jgi:nitrite reductase/ring-hydroxylating ferredoxin subunit